jgi:hypothetical protein
MKAVVFFLALLAAAKLGYQEYLFRAATKEAIIGAYKEHAVQACQRDARGASLGIGPQAWSSPSSIRLVIGKGTLDVYPWQVDHAMWNARYRHPYPCSGRPWGHKLARNLQLSAIAGCGRAARGYLPICLRRAR